MKKTAKTKGGAKGTKLQLKKETIKDLGALKSKAAAVKGGRAAACKCGTSYTD
jgi:hypothetical protein